MTLPPESLIRQASQAAFDLAAQLASTQTRLVLAERCTCGLVSAVLGQCPGISNWLCGSLASYREGSKQAWLDVDADLIAKHTAESAVVTKAMAVGALSVTPEADLAVAITGHLGPDAPEHQDGVIFIAALRRADKAAVVQSTRLQATQRVARQWEAALAALTMTYSQIN